ncbi:hypothetical protein B0H17DRAFT_1077077 [Mycena rosella]|uniref:Uncharacterized protein n=1 Tax=Mycena rosella TaxID=1033263 RepID=A0AAD7D5S6_MYCRO|nr:hypothetical protein B0H17DRAFT_1108966 [Mycena rosella]KAJ7680169.1 hypothetical protein B0H17DRAFT_1077077 [Mycena rosella]
MVLALCLVVAPRMTDERCAVLWCLAPLSARSRVAAQLHLHLGRIALVATASWYASCLLHILSLTPAFLSRSFHVMRDAHGRCETSGTAIFLCVPRFITLFLEPRPSPVFLYIASGRARSRPHWRRHAGLRDVLNVGHLLDRPRAPTSSSLGMSSHHLQMRGCCCGHEHTALCSSSNARFPLQYRASGGRAMAVPDVNSSSRLPRSHTYRRCAHVRSRSDSVHRPRVQLILVRVGDRDRVGATMLIPSMRRVGARACEQTTSGERLWNVRASEGEQSQIDLGRLAAAPARRSVLIEL